MERIIVSENGCGVVAVLEAPKTRLLQLVITAKVGGTKKVLVKNGTPFPISIECVPTHEVDMWVEDVANAVDRELSHDVGFNIMFICESTPLLRNYRRRTTEVFVYTADFPSENIGTIAPGAYSFNWVDAEQVSNLLFAEKEDRATLLLALSPD
ncbi:MAG: hypothetical protein NTZ87_03340 [Candidatus Nomurabacteria bacterium]|nr:hypothetical protein [Candidatus Nomurabacteria bacterium]